MNKRQLQYFLEVYKQGNISKAAGMMYISPQGLSKMILSLEQELGVALFEHKSNSIIPTEAAHRLVGHAQKILEEMELIENLKFDVERIVKKVYIPCSYDVLQYIPVQFIEKLDYTDHSIRMKYQELPDNITMDKLMKNEAELAILPGPLPIDEFEYVPLFSDDYCLMINIKHPLAEKQEITFKDLDNELLAIKEIHNKISESQHNQFWENDSHIHIFIETTDSHQIHNMAIENKAIGMTLTKLADKVNSDKIVIRPFSEKNVKKVLYLVWKKNARLSSEAELVKNILLEVFEKNV